MKQKRKVKSLISSKNGGNAFLATLLFLLGGILFLGAMALFTSLGGVASAAGEGNLEYNGIDDNVEVLLDLKFGEDGRSDMVKSNMFLTGGNFYVKGNAGISLDVTDASINGYVNYLGGDSSEKQIIISSNNVTVVGGNGVQVHQGNTNATSLGGEKTTISAGNNSVAPVMLGGTNNVIEGSQVGNAIVGGNNNTVKNGGLYDFIIGGNNNTVNGNRVIVGGANVDVQGMTDLFVFSDGEGVNPFKPKGGKAFYLKVANGLGLNRTSDNKGVASSGSVSFGEIDIISQRCTSEDIGVQGTWLGCLVGCTQKGADDVKKRWEMIDHGDVCEGYCRDNSEYCIIDPIEPEPKEDYPSYCTTEGVIIEHTIPCYEKKLGVYENVVFETTLIDYSQECPENSENKCIFRCEKGYHLGWETSSIDGNNTGRRKCYQNCTLPWNREEILHNDTVDAYNVTSVKCSNYAYTFPQSTSIINVPTAYYVREWDSDSQMYKATRGDGNGYGHSPETCENFDHKKKLVCKDGTLYIAKDDNTPTSTPAIGVTGAKYIYNECTLGNFTCSTIEGYYNLTKTFINENDDGVTYRDQWDRSQEDAHRTTGRRGIYEMCADYVADAGSNSSCRVPNSDTSYHYKLVKCQPGYSTGTTDNTVSPYKCMQGCNLKKRNGTNQRYPHNSTLTGYKAPTKQCSAVCPGETCVDVCEAATITCNDGNWVMGSSKNGTTQNSLYLYNDCYLNDKTCNTSTYNVTQTEWNSHHEHGIYNNCDPYSSSDHKFLCTKGSTRYDLVGCDEGYHTDNTTASRNNPKSWNKWCISNYRTEYCSDSSKPNNSEWNTRNYDKYEWSGPAYNNGSWSHTEGDYCAWKCRTGYHKEGSFSCVDDMRIVNCDDYVNKPTYASWNGNGQGIQGWQGTWDDGDWGPVEGCGWHCNEGYQDDGAGGCDAIYCTQSGGPANSYYIDTNVQLSAPATCDWACYCGYYKNGNSCSSCSAGTYSTAGSNSCSSCPSGQQPNSNQCGCEAEDTYTCEAGEYLPANSTSCSTCPCGYECEGGSFPVRGYDQGKDKCASGRYSTAGSNSCSSCPSGQQPNSTQCSCETIPDDSIHCDAGTYLKKNSTICSQCPCGYYCSGGDFDKSTTTDQGINGCAGGTYSTAGSSSCSSCPSGRQPNSTQCSCETIPDDSIHCDAGTYLKKNSTTCSQCPCGYYCSGGDFDKSTTTDQGINGCASGKYSTAGSSSCSSCPSGQQPNSTQCSCETTPDPTYTCAAGKYLPKNSTTCSTCPCGYYCPGGDFYKSTTTDQGINGCAGGTYSTAGSSSCSSCPSGQQPNSTQCSCETTPDPTYTCEAGKYLPKNSTTCSTCPCGYYCPGGNFSKSTTTDQGKFECGAGKWSSAGATSSNSCGNINCGYYGTNACSATPSGQTCTSTNISYSTAGSSSCSSCQNPNVANATHCGCRPSSYGSCDLSEPYGCGDGNTLNETDTTESTEWQWYCKGEDDTGNGQYCHKGCPEGKTLKWNSLHNGECVDSGGTDGRCNPNVINGCLEGDLIANTASNYIYTWTCKGSKGTSQTCRSNCNIYCGSTWNTCNNGDDRSSIGSNQEEMNNINSNFAGRWGWKCNSSNNRPAGCTAETSILHNEGYYLEGNLCGCTTYNCSNYASYGYHDERYGGQSYQQWPVGVGLPSGCFADDGNYTNGGGILCYRARYSIGGSVVGVDGKPEGIGYGEDIYGNKNVTCGCEFDPGTWGGDVEDVTSLTVNYCARGKSVTYNGQTVAPCKDPIAANCTSNASLKHGSTYGKTLSVDVNESPYEPAHVVTVTLGTPDCCEKYTCSQPQNGKPDHSHYINTSVQSCSQSVCDWDCDTGYRKEGNTCVLNQDSCHIKLYFMYGGSRSDEDGNWEAYVMYYQGTNSNNVQINQYLDAPQSVLVDLGTISYGGNGTMYRKPVVRKNGVYVDKGAVETVDAAWTIDNCASGTKTYTFDFF